MCHLTSSSRPMPLTSNALAMYISLSFSIHKLLFLHVDDAYICFVLWIWNFYLLFCLIYFLVRSESDCSFGLFDEIYIWILLLWMYSYAHFSVFDSPASTSIFIVSFYWFLKWVFYNACRLLQIITPVATICCAQAFG